MSRYYDFDGNGFNSAPSDIVRTRLRRGILSRDGVGSFLRRCEREFGPVVRRQAQAVLVDRAYIDDQNSNALASIRALAAEREEWDLALALGDYFDRMAY